MTDLRNHLFATLEALQDKDDPMDIDRAKAIAEVGKVMVDSAKVEVAFISATDGQAPSKCVRSFRKTRFTQAPASRRSAQKAKLYRAGPYLRRLYDQKKQVVSACIFDR